MHLPDEPTPTATHQPPIFGRTTYHDPDAPPSEASNSYRQPPQDPANDDEENDYHSNHDSDDPDHSPTSPNHFPPRSHPHTSAPTAKNPTPQAPLPSTANAAGKTVMDMPLRHGREAPPTFKGKWSEVQYFIQHYDRLLLKYNVDDPKDKCHCILDYCSTDVQAFIKASEFFQKRDWPRLRREILRCYDVDRAAAQYRPGDITAYTQKTNKKVINNLTRWKKYYIRYKTMAGTLLQANQITRASADTYFWLGIHKDLRQVLENRILQMTVPNGGIGQAGYYSMYEINQAAEWYFRRNRAEAMIMNAADYDINFDDGFSDSSDDSDADSESEDSDYDSYRRKHREKKKARKEKDKIKKRRRELSKSRSSDHLSTKSKGEERAATIKPTGSAAEVTDLIRKINKMSLDDAEYAPTYYSILALDTTGVAAKCVKPPQVQTTPSWAPTRPPTPRPALRNSAPPVSAPVTTAPATYPNNIPVGAGSVPQRNFPDCFGCGKDDHRMRDCVEIQSLFKDGVVKNDEQTGRLCMKDGSPIRRMYGEHLAQAARRQAGPRVMFGVIDVPEAKALPYSSSHIAHVAFQEFSDDSDDESEDSLESPHIEEVETSEEEPDSDELSEEGDVYLTVPRRRYQVHAADRTVPSTKTARKMAFDGVHLPRREKSATRKISVGESKDASQIPPPTSQKPPIERKAASLPKPSVGKIRDILNDVRPYDARPARENKVQDIEMPDAERSGKSPATSVRRQKENDSVTTAPKLKRLAPTKPSETAEKSAPATRQSEIQNTVNLPKIVERILDLEVPMSVREVLVSSKELRNNLQDLVKLKNTKTVLAGAQSAPWNWSRSEGVLIRAEMEIGGRPIVAIIDTGSQLNVVRADVAALVLHRPVDMTKTTGMNDANGGRGQLRGFIQEVELSCGGVLTKTSLWVSQAAPFELLLGRPWQRNNLVTIDERDEGTYLIFKDKETRQPRYELMAVPHEATSEVLCLQTPEASSLAVFVDKPKEKRRPRLTLDTQVAERFNTGRNNKMEIDSSESSTAASRQIPNCRCGSLTAIDLASSSPLQNGEKALGGTERSPKSPWCEAELSTNAGKAASAGMTRPRTKEESICQQEKRENKRKEEETEPTTLLAHPLHCHHVSHPLANCSQPFYHPMDIDPHPPASNTLQQQHREYLDAIQRTINRLEAEQYDHRPPVRQTGFGAVDRRASAPARHTVQAIATAQDAAFREGRPIHVRPGRVESDQVQYLGQDAHRDGQEVHRVAFMNARMSVHDPSTGEYGVRSGHMVGHLYVDPQERRKWRMHLPYPSQQRVRRYLDESKAEAEVINAQKLAMKRQRLTEIKQKRRISENAAPKEPIPPPNPSPPSPPVTRATANKSAQNNRDRRGKFKKIAKDEAFYITHPANHPPPCDTSNMSRIGVTKASGDVVYRVNTDEATRLTGKLTRPGTPRPPFTLLTEQPGDLIPYALPSTTSPSTSGTPESGGYVEILIPRIFFAEEDASTSNEMEVEEASVTRNRDASSVSAPITEDSSAPITESRPAQPNGTSPRNSVSAAMSEQPTERRDQWDGERQIHLSPTTVADVNRRLAEAYQRLRRPPTPHPLLPLVNDDGSSISGSNEAVLAAPPSSPSDESSGAESAARLTKQDAIPLPDATLTLLDVPASPLAACDEEEYETAPEEPGHSEELTSYLYLLADAAEVMDDRPEEDEMVHIEVDGSHIGTGIVLVGSRDSSPLTEPPPTPVLRAVSIESTPGPVLRAVSVESPPPFKLATLHEHPNEIILSPDSDDDLPALMYLDGTDSTTPPSTSATNGDSSSEELSDDDGFVVVKTQALVTALEDLYCVIPEPAVDEVVRAIHWVQTQRWSTDLYHYQVRIDLWEDEDVLKPAIRALRVLYMKLPHLIDHQAMARHELFDHEDLAMQLERDMGEVEQVRRGNLVSIHISGRPEDEGFNQSQGRKFKAETFAAISTPVGEDRRRIPRNPTLPAALEGQPQRVFNNFARERGALFCNTVALFVTENLADVNALTEVRINLLEFMRRAALVTARRHWPFNMACLHEPAPYPLPIFTGSEQHRMRLINEVHQTHGHHRVVEIVTDILRLRFRDTQVILNLLHSGMLDFNNNAPDSSASSPSSSETRTKTTDPRTTARNVGNTGGDIPPLYVSGQSFRPKPDPYDACLQRIPNLRGDLVGGGTGLHSSGSNGLRDGNRQGFVMEIFDVEADREGMGYWVRAMDLFLNRQYPAEEEDDDEGIQPIAFEFPLYIRRDCFVERWNMDAL
ncbi:hypothetical protein R3P38DRAFT_3195224 [Favolaschia claudopus]|uniref:CCHC-type domain-containing protein n=1 Tax=Favolaschia claudopus TaxID=2862362 RepID=A0AAW0BE47_9AGAR